MRTLKRLTAVLLILSVAFLFVQTVEAADRGGGHGEGEEGSALFPSKQPSSGGTLRLLSVDVPQSGNLSPNIAYWTTIHFEADVLPEIRRACFGFSGGGQACVDVQAKDVIYGSHPYFRVLIHVPAGSRRIDCYAEYIREGKTHRTNTVTYRVIGMRPKE